MAVNGLRERIAVNGLRERIERITSHPLNPFNPFLNPLTAPLDPWKRIAVNGLRERTERITSHPLNPFLNPLTAPLDPFSNPLAAPGNGSLSTDWGSGLDGLPPIRSIRSQIR